VGRPAVCRGSANNRLPAVTVGVLAAGAMRVRDAVGYIVSQLVGAIAGALLLRTVLDGAATGLGTPQLAQGLVLGATTLKITPEAGFVIEALLAFFLVTVVLSTAVAGRAGNLAPLAIGMTLTLNIIMGGALTGAVFNPARALGPMVATGNFADAWLYTIAPIVGAVIAAFAHLGDAARARTADARTARRYACRMSVARTLPQSLASPAALETVWRNAEQVHHARPMTTPMSRRAHL
jgi:aquaporin Z